jgi:hypothetical protein
MLAALSAVQALAQTPAIAPVATAPTSSTSFATPAKPPGVGAVVKTDGAIVYKQPDFDAPVITSLAKGANVRVSRGVTGQYAKFHKVKVGDQIGYIADIDVNVEGTAPYREAKQIADRASAEKTKTKKRKRSDANSGAREASGGKKSKAKKHQEPIMFTRYVGLSLGETWYKEGITGVDASATLTTYGLKMTGPDILLNGALMDFNLILHYGAPSYYGPLSSTPPSGFVLWTDALFLLPFVQGFNHMFYLAAGPMLALSDFKVVNGGHSQDLMALKIGLDGAIGAGFRVDKTAFKLEAKYIYEKQVYHSLGFAVQTQY